MKPLVLVTVRPGPVLHIWRDGQELARLPLDLHGALSLAADLLAATARAEGGGGGGRISGRFRLGTGGGTFRLPKPAPVEITGDFTT